ncbi:MAG: VWA domain-containing protein [Sulfurovum sp.]|nr:VWA domain-containing protein [Sulfurovum sp.]
MKDIFRWTKQSISVFLLFAFTMAWAQNPKAVIIFDASGSMWGQIDGKAKITIAKEALQSVVKKWNPDTELGLTVYGHRTKGDCNDIETVVPVAKIDKEKILSVVKGIQPKGKTPISRTLKKVAEEMKSSEEKSTIILISDGKESCDADPCATAKELKKQGINFVAHVIGFNVDKNTDAQLECIADTTGGEYFSAKDATALNDAMDSIVEKVEKVEKPKPVAKKTENDVEITASEKEGGKWLNSYHIIYRQGEDGKATGKKMTGYSFKTTKEKPLIKKLPLGKYILKSEYKGLKKETAFEIKADEVNKLHIAFEQFVIKTKCLDMGVEVSYEVYAHTGRMVHSIKKSCSEVVQLALDAGDYTVEAKTENNAKEEKFSIGGSSHDLIIDMTKVNSKEALIQADTPSKETNDTKDKK